MESTRASLLARIRDRDHSRAWSEFDAIYRPILFRFARSQGLAGTDAEEVAQLVLARVARRIGQFQYDPDRGRFRGWLWKLVAHQISDLGGLRDELVNTGSGLLRS